MHVWERMQQKVLRKLDYKKTVVSSDRKEDK